MTLQSPPPLPTNTVPVHEAARQAFKFSPPVTDAGGAMTWAMWAAYHEALGHELARRMREYGGPAIQDEPPPGGTPVAASMRMAA